MYGRTEIDALKATKSPPATQVAHEAISQARAYVTLYNKDFFAGKELSRLIRRGDTNASKKGNLARITIRPIASVQVDTGAKVEQVVGGKTTTGKLWKAVQLGDDAVWVELQDCVDFLTGLTLNGGSVGEKVRFQASSDTTDHVITVGNSGEGAASFAAKVTGIDVYVMVVQDDVDPRLSPFKAVPGGCSPFLMMSDDMRNAIRYLACLDKAHSRIDDAGDDVGGVDMDGVSLTIALPDHKLAVKDFDYASNKQHFAKGAKFPNLQCDVKIFEDVSVNSSVVATIKAAYATCFATRPEASEGAGGFLPILATRKMRKERQRSAGEVARDALCAISPTAKLVLSLRAAENSTCPKRIREVEASLGLIGKNSKKRKTGTGREKVVAEVPYNVLWYAVQDMLLLGNWTPDQLRKLLRRAAHIHGTIYGNTVKVKDIFDASDDAQKLKLGLQLAWFKRPLDDRVRCESLKVFEATDDGYSQTELDLSE